MYFQGNLTYLHKHPFERFIYLKPKSVFKKHCLIAYFSAAVSVVERTNTTARLVSNISKVLFGATGKPRDAVQTRTAVTPVPDGPSWLRKGKSFPPLKTPCCFG